LMVLGYDLGDQQVWYSSDRAFIKTKQGYLADTDGFEVNWHNVQGPSLERALQLTRPTAYTRTRNQSPGYRYEIRESVLLTPLAGPPKDAPTHLLQNPALRWFKEEVRSQFAEQLPITGIEGIFAIDPRQQPYQIVYAKQCLRADYCLQWQALELITRAGS
jgi:hypothetical protein